MKTIRIQDHEPNEPLSFDLRDILSECTRYSLRSWVAWRVDWATAEAYGPEVLEYFLTVCNGGTWEPPNDQLVFRFSDLQECARCVVQTENGFFLAVRPDVAPDNIPKLRTLADCERLSDLIIHAFDFSFWEVTTEDDDLVQRLARKYTQTIIFDEMMDGGSGIPRR